MINYKIIGFDTLLSDEKLSKQFNDLLALQWEEVDHRRKTSDLNVDFSQYLKMQEIGMHYTVFALDDDEIIGYMSMFNAESPHTREMTASTDTVFINKKYRKNGIGSGMVKEAEKEAIARGCKHIMITFKNNHRHDNIVNDMGFFSYETIYAKYIGDL